MEHLPRLIEDLALILITGAIVTLLFKSIRQPIVLGYIIAGFFVGPHMSLVPTVVDLENVRTLAEIGIIFLLFSLGLEFNLKKLLHIGGASSITALVEIVFITLAGFGLGKLLGWSLTDSIFLGGMLASSSTTIIIKAFDDLNIKTLHYAKIVFGVLVVEDIVVILLLVLLPSIAVTQAFSGNELLLTLIKLPVFLVIMFVTGIFLLPNILKRAKKVLNEEVSLILYTGLCLGMVVLASRIGVSAELGAFLMGFILAESTSAEKIEQLIKPVKNLFAAVFFISIGMMIDPPVIIAHKWAVVAVTLLTIFGKFFSTSGGALLSGQTLKQSVQVGMSMAQIGEFAFIVAALGLSLGVISEVLFPVAVGASAITTFTTPYMIKFSGRMYDFLEKILPAKWILNLNRYSHSASTIQRERNWKKVLKSYGSLIFINLIISVALIFLSLKLLIPLLQDLLGNSLWVKFASLILILGIMFPFIWGVMAKKPKRYAYKELWSDSRYSHGPLLIIEILRIITGLLLTGFIVTTVFPKPYAALLLVPLVLAVLVIFSRQVNSYYNKLEKRFMLNLNTEDKDINQGSRRMRQRLTEHLDSSPWDAQLVELKVRPYAQFAGKTLESLAWREKYGINIAYIRRGDDIDYTPGRSSVLFPYDKAGIIAAEDELQKFRVIFDALPEADTTADAMADIVITSFLVNQRNKLAGKSLKESGIRKNTNGFVLGIERKGERIFNPGSSTVFEINDIVWIAGDRKKISEIYA